MFQFQNIFYPLCYGNNLVKVRLLLLQISILVGLLFDRNISMTFYILRHVTLLHQCQCTLVSGRFKLMTSFDRLMTSNQELKKVMSNPEFSSGRPRSLEVTKTEFQIFLTWAFKEFPVDMWNFIFTYWQFINGCVWIFMQSTWSRIWSTSRVGDKHFLHIKLRHFNAENNFPI